MLHIYLTRTTVSVLATKVEIPDEISIKQALGFHKEINRVRFVQNLDLPNHQDYEARIADFYHCNQSKISDLQENKHISLFLLAHQSQL